MKTLFKTGWFPIYDTMHGIRGEIKVQAKVEIFTDFNEYRKSSCGVQFFCSSYFLLLFDVKMFIVEVNQWRLQGARRLCAAKLLQLCAGAAYQWRPWISMDRQDSNSQNFKRDEAKTFPQTFRRTSSINSMISTLSINNCVMVSFMPFKRRIGLKVRDMGANCVLGYIQMFDLEGEHGIVVRGLFFVSANKSWLVVK